MPKTERFLKLVPPVEKVMVDDGIILIKYFLNVSREEQTRRLESRIDDPRKVWKLSPTDLKSYSRRFDYLRARDTMIVETSSGWAPWHIVPANHKWYRNLVVSDRIVRALEGMKLKYPRPRAARHARTGH